MDNPLVAPMLALAQVLAIDVILAADNAVAVGFAVAGLAPAQRKIAIIAGLAGAVVTRTLFALIAVWLLSVPGLLLVGGLLLAWVAWTMWRELRATEEPDGAGEAPPVKSLPRAVFQVLAADVSMSLDNVLAVAGAARDHPRILATGLLLSVVLMGFWPPMPSPASSSAIAGSPMPAWPWLCSWREGCCSTGLGSSLGWLDERASMTLLPTTCAGLQRLLSGRRQKVSSWRQPAGPLEP